MQWKLKLIYGPEHFLERYHDILDYPNSMDIGI